MQLKHLLRFIKIEKTDSMSAENFIDAIDNVLKTTNSALNFVNTR